APRPHREPHSFPTRRSSDLPGVLVKITDEGEVIAHGPNIFKGYWENEEATRAAIDKDGWFHTGDLGKFDADGFLWLHGRKKDMRSEEHTSELQSRGHLVCRL